jgi:hypothetical protein
MSEVQGHRLDDTKFGNLPFTMKNGDFWLYLNPQTGKPLKPEDRWAPASTNLTGTVWGFKAPNGCGIGTLVNHTVREEADGTISVRPDDGSSNSILHSYRSGSEDLTWHGYIEHGLWIELSQ